MSAPFCPVTRGQRNLPRGLSTPLPSIPLATDLPSLIRAVNIMRDILRTLTTSLTVNNVYSGTGKPSQQYGSKSYLMSKYQADWYQVGREDESGFVYYKTRKGPDKTQRAYINRIHAVELRNVNRDSDTSFFWRYFKALDGEEGDSGGTLFEEDYFERIVNVHWSTLGVFGFAGGIIYQKVTYLPEVGSPGDLQLSWLGGTSKDGERWDSGGPTLDGLAWTCCVRGKIGSKPITIAVGNISVDDWYGPGYARFYTMEPAAGVSYDDGRTWKDAGLPLQEVTITPADPTTGAPAEIAQGGSFAVVYHPPTQTFYAGASVMFVLRTRTYYEDRMYKSTTGSSFSEVYSEERAFTAPFKGYRWPEVVMTPTTKPTDRLRVADKTMTTKPGPGVLFVVSFGPGQPAEYETKGETKTWLAVSADRTAVLLGGKTIRPPMKVVNSVCGGAKHIVAVGWEDEDRLVGPVTFVSKDDGLSWKQELSGLKFTAPGIHDKDSGQAAGSCSFCPP